MTLESKLLHFNDIHNYEYCLIKEFFWKNILCFDDKFCLCERKIERYSFKSFKSIFHLICPGQCMEQNSATVHHRLSFVTTILLIVIIMITVRR